MLPEVHCHGNELDTLFDIFEQVSAASVKVPPVCSELSRQLPHQLWERFQANCEASPMPQLDQAHFTLSEAATIELWENETTYPAQLSATPSS